MARIEVFPERCIGAGNCAQLAPAQFDQDSTGTVVLRAETVAAEHDDEVTSAVEACPVLAIEFVDEL